MPTQLTLIPETQKVERVQSLLSPPSKQRVPTLRPTANTYLADHCIESHLVTILLVILEEIPPCRNGFKNGRRSGRISLAKASLAVCYFISTSNVAVAYPLQRSPSFNVPEGIHSPRNTFGLLRYTTVENALHLTMYFLFGQDSLTDNRNNDGPTMFCCCHWMNVAFEYEIQGQFGIYQTSCNRSIASSSTIARDEILYPHEGKSHADRLCCKNVRPRL